MTCFKPAPGGSDHYEERVEEPEEENGGEDEGGIEKPDLAGAS